jgi:hypothetical protein
MWTEILNAALLYGLGLCLVLTTIAVVSGAAALDMWVGDYPPDIRQKYGPMSPRAARLRPFVAVAFFLAILAILFLGLAALQSRLGRVPFVMAFVFTWGALLVFNVFDLLVLDWLFFCTIQPRAMVLPGTEGMPGYRDYRFHLVGFLKGLGFTVAAGVIVAAAWTGVQAML